MELCSYRLVGLESRLTTSLLHFLHTRGFIDEFNFDYAFEGSCVRIRFRGYNQLLCKINVHCYEPQRHAHLCIT